MKKIIITGLVVIFLAGIFPAMAMAQGTTGDVQATMKGLSDTLCMALKSQDRSGFEAMLDTSAKNQMQWWWDSSGKGKDFAGLYGSCAFDSIDDKAALADQQKVFIQRFNKDGSKWSRPAPVVFKKTASGDWKIVSYSL